MKKYTNLIIKLLISSGLLFIILNNIDEAQLKQSFEQLNIQFIPIIVLLLILNYVVSSIRWKKLLIHENSKDIEVSYLTGLYFIGAFFNNFMPTSMGGDVYKVFKLGKKIGSTVDAFSATFMERFTGVIALCLISAVSLINLLGWWGVLLLVGLVFGIFLSFYVLKILSARYAKLKKLYDSLMVYKGQRSVLVFALLTSFVVQLIAIFTQYFVFLALGVRLPVGYSMFIFPVITLAGFFVPSLNGIGVQDSLYMQLFSVIGISTAVSLTASVVYHLLRLGVSLIGGIVLVLSKD